MQPTRPLGPAVKAEVTADYYGLTYTRITEQGTEARVFTPSLDALARWFVALGGRITCDPAGPGVCLWTLHTTTGKDGVTIRIHTPTLDTDQIDADCADAIRPHAA